MLLLYVHVVVFITMFDVLTLMQHVMQIAVIRTEPIMPQKQVQGLRNRSNSFVFVASSVFVSLTCKLLIISPALGVDDIRAKMSEAVANHEVSAVCAANNLRPCQQVCMTTMPCKARNRLACKQAA